MRRWVPDPWQGISRSQKALKRMADGSLGGATNLASPVSFTTGAQIAPSSRVTVGEGGSGRYPATLTVAASDASALSIATADIVCDGTDDHLDIIDALEECDTLGFGRALLSEGSFHLGILGIYGGGGLLSNVVLQGQGKDITTLFHHSPSAANAFTLNNYADKFHVADLTFDASDVLDGGYGVYIFGGESSVQRVRFRYMGAQSVANLDMRGSRPIVRECDFDDTADTGAGGVYVSSRFAVVQDCRFKNVNDISISGSAQSAMVTGNVARFDNVDTNSTDSVVVGADSIVIGNIFEGDSATATITSGANSEVANNRLM